MTQAKAVLSNNLNIILPTLPVYVIHVYVQHIYDFEEYEMFLFVATKANSALKV